MGRPDADRDPSRAALALLARHEESLRRVASRCSLCPDDADDAFQRAVEILLAHASRDRLPQHLAAWMRVVIRNEALAVRRERERILRAPAAAGREPEPTTALDRLASTGSGPDELVERREQIEVAFAALVELKPAERLAVFLQACGYSYAEIADACGWTYTKVNRSLTEGRRKLRFGRSGDS